MPVEFRPVDPLFMGSRLEGQQLLDKILVITASRSLSTAGRHCASQSPNLQLACDLNPCSIHQASHSAKTDIDKNHYKILLGYKIKG